MRRAFFDPGPTLENFAAIGRSTVYLSVFLKTLTLAATVTVVSIALGYPVAYALVNARGRWKAIGWGFVIVPFWISLLARNYAWMMLLQREGPVSKLAAWFGLGRISMVFGFWGVVIAMVHVLMPIGILCMAAVMRRIDNRLIDAGQSLGARPWRAFVRIYLRMSMPGLMAGGILVFILSLGFYITPALLGGRREVTVAMLIEQQVNQLLNWGFASALSVCLVLAAVLCYLVAAKLTRFEFATGRK